MTTPIRTVGPRARPLASRVAFGFGTGIALGATLGALAWIADELGHPWSQLIPANTIGAWLGLGFLLGTTARTVPTGALRGLIGLLRALVVYYLLISVSEAGFRVIGAPHAATTWGAVALVAGPIFGAAGGAWRHWVGWRRAFAVGLLAAAFIAEGVVYGKLGLSDVREYLFLIEIVIGFAIPFVLLRPAERLGGYVATGLLALLLGAAIEPVNALVRGIADRF